ncbi:MAG: CRISPR-associated protein Cas4 [Deinococcales bacterium]
MNTKNFSEDDYLLISKINTVVFCPRRYFIEVVLAESMINFHLIEGQGLHERSKREGESWVWSDTLGLVGIVDKVTRQAGKLVPHEFKKGRLDDHENNQVQLCALAVCLEERHGERIDEGIIYYHSSRRQMPVVFDEALRQRLFEAIDTMRQLNHSKRYPDITSNPHKCQGCSVQATCQPQLQRKSA